MQVSYSSKIRTANSAVSICTCIFFDFSTDFDSRLALAFSGTFFWVSYNVWVANSLLIRPSLLSICKNALEWPIVVNLLERQNVIDDQLLTLLWLKGQELITTGVRVCSCFMQSLSIASEQNFCSLTIADSFFISEILPAISAILYQCCDSWTTCITRCPLGINSGYLGLCM